MRTRLRPKYSDAELRYIYREPHQHGKWFDHKVRVQTTIALARSLEFKGSSADLSAGDAAIINALETERKYIGDYAPGYEFTGPIEQTIHQIPNVQLFICSETIEHLDNPDAVLAEIRKKAEWIVVTTPLGENDTRNPEHYWGWDAEGVESMLVHAGWNPFMVNLLYFKDKENYDYDYQMWVCR